MALFSLATCTFSPSLPTWPGNKATNKVSHRLWLVFIPSKIQVAVGELSCCKAIACVVLARYIAISFLVNKIILCFVISCFIASPHCTSLRTVADLFMSFFYPLTTDDKCTCHFNFGCMLSLVQSDWKIGFVLAKNGGTEGGGQV